MGTRKFKFKSSFSTWLYRIALNRCITYMKKRPVVLEPEDGPDPHAALSRDYEQRARLSAIKAAMARLKGPQQLCFHLFYVEEWDLGRIAETLDCREGTVKSHLNRARKRIRMDEEVLQWQT